MDKPYDPFASEGYASYDHCDIRICFAIAWYRDEADAIACGEQRRKDGDTYNGGYYHGMLCGRDSTWDYTKPDGTKLYACTF